MKNDISIKFEWKSANFRFLKLIHITTNQVQHSESEDTTNDEEDEEAKQFSTNAGNIK